MPAEQPKNSEAELLGLASLGDRQAFGILYETYLDQIYRYIYYRVADGTEAEDMTETVFLNAWQALPKLAKNKAGPDNFRAWLYRIAHNVVVDHHRANRSTASLDKAASIPDPNPSPESTAQMQQDSRHLAATISRLEPNLQQVLVCRFINQMSHDETAKIMGMKPGYVRVLQHRALKKMAKLLTTEAG